MVSIKYDNLFLKTLREDPTYADTNGYKLLIRANYIKNLGSGIFEWLPLGIKMLRKVEKIVREEMENIGANEVLLPALIPAEPYQKTNRFEEYGPNLFRLKDRKGSDYLLGPTHEELFTLLSKTTYTSYKDLPSILYQIQTKYRDEARPRAGLIRSREFIMKDSYSFDISEKDLKVSYEKHRNAYLKIFERIGLEVIPVSAQSGAMGGSRSEEFLHPSKIGEDTFIRTKTYAANTEAFKPKIPDTIDFSLSPEFEKIDTPNMKTIEDVASFFKTQKSNLLKAVVYTGVIGDKRQLIVSFVEGDREVDEKRLSSVLSPIEIEEASEEDFLANPKIIRGFIGPNINNELDLTPKNKNYLKPLFIFDSLITKGKQYFCGGNEIDKHYQNVILGRNFEAQKIDGICEVKDGDTAFDGSIVKIERGIEMGHIFELGQKYSKALDFEVLDESGKLQTVWMGSYGVGVSRIVAALAETYNDEYGLKIPDHLAPFDYYLIEANESDEVKSLSQKIQDKFNKENKDILVDDRPKVSIGVKFKDSELLGIPKIIVVGKMASENKYELKLRSTGEKQEILFED